MSKIQTFEQFLTMQTIHVPVLGFVVNLLLSALLSLILTYIYVNYGKSLSNRKVFAHNFMLITMATVVVITIVKSSLALSLGLVGALSIVRFRTAIKEPEELAYLFISIAVGLGLGADQRVITIVGFIIMCLMIFLKNHWSGAYQMQNLHLTVSTSPDSGINLDKVIEVIKKYCSEAQLRRFDESKDHLEASFVVVYNDYKSLQKTKDKLRELSPSLKITFLDIKGIGA